MPSKLIFGWHLDGGSYPETAEGLKFSFGTQICGPAGFVEFMEMRLGLGGPKVSPAIRTAQYLAKLREVDDGRHFFSRSLMVDGWATALYLLRKRDELVQAGWQPHVSGNESGRLAVMARLERAGKATLSPGFADRLAELVASVERMPRVGVDNIHLATPSRLLPPIWARMFLALAESGSNVEELPPPRAVSAGDLLVVQRALLGERGGALAGDGSFAVLESDDELQAAASVAAWLRAAADKNEDLVIVRGQGASLLDECCHAVGLPRPGGGKISRWRGTLQVLPLAFELVWHPVNPSRLLEFLSLAPSPVPKSVAYFFKEALREQPGVGGQAWQAAWERASVRWRDRLLAEGTPADTVDKQLARDIEEWRAWLEPDRCHPKEGIPARDAEALCKRVQRWAGRRTGADVSGLFADLADCCSDTAQAIRESGLERISRVQIQRIIDAVFAHGRKMPGSGAEAAAWTAVDHPGQIWAAAPKILWWGFAARERSVPLAFWTGEELEHLRSRGVEIEQPHTSFVREADAWRRAVLNASQQLVIVRPRTANGETADSHPFWHELKAILHFDGQDNRLAALHQAHDVLSAGISRFAGREPGYSPVRITAPPSGRRYWLLGGSEPVLPEKESYTSISRLLACPLSWLLGQSMRLKPGVLLDLPDAERLAGNLAHLVVASLFSEKPVWKEAEAAERALEIFDDVLPAAAAPLLQPGMSLELSRCRTAIERAVRALVRYLNSAELEVVACETKREEPFEHGVLQGTLDLLCADRDGRLIVIDLKWTRSTEFRRKEIREGRPVQLAIYSQLVAGESKGDPQAGYFMLTDGKLFFTAPQPFPAHCYVAGSELPLVWQKVVSSYGLQMQRFKSGVATATGVGEPEEGEKAFKAKYQDKLLELEPPCKLCDFRRICAIQEAER